MNERTRDQLPGAVMVDAVGLGGSVLGSLSFSPGMLLGGEVS